MMYVVINDEEEYFVELKFPDVENNYMISNYGSIISHTGIKLRADTSNGYCRVTIKTLSGKFKKFFVHRLVAYNFISPSDGKDVNHKTGNKLNNFYRNLEWVTKSENSIHAYRTGLAIGRYYPHENKKGEERYNAIVDEKMVHSICKLLEERLSTFSIKKEIDFGILTSLQVNSLIHHLRKRNSWSHITNHYKY